MSPAITDLQSIEEDDYTMKVGEEDAIASALAEIPQLEPKENTKPITIQQMPHQMIRC